MGSSISTPKVTSHDRAILELKVQRDRLKQYHKKLKSIADRETEIAKNHLKVGHKDRALLALKKKKYQEQLMAKTDAQLLNLEQMTASIEFAQVELEVFKGLKQGNSILGELQKEMSIEDVEMLMQETAEAMAYQNQISTMFSEQMSAKDEEDIMTELDEIASEVENQKNEELNPPLELPSVPTHAPTIPEHQPCFIEDAEEPKSTPMLV